MRRPPKFNRILSSDLTLIIREWVLRGSPRQHGIDWPIDEWLVDFPEYEGFLKSLKSKNLGMLDRNLVKEVTSLSIHSGELEHGFLACMIWGFGNRGYAQHRTKKILTSENFRNTLQETIGHLQQGNVAEAYRALIEEGPEGLGCSFGTKYLYFASSDEIDNPPIIVDALVAKALNELTLFRANPVRMTSELYVRLLDEFSQASSELGLAPDVLEEILFDVMSRKSSGSNWGSTSESQLSDREKKSWVLSLITDMIRKGESLEVERTHPGGGQYDCIVIKSRSGIQVEFNVKGSIHIFKPVATHPNWNTALDLGLLETSRRMRGSTESRERAMPSRLADSYSWLSRALIGKAEIDVEDFESFFMMTDQQKAEFESINEGNSRKEIENSFILFVGGQSQAMLLPWQGIVLTRDGKQMKIEPDCYMPVENYYGDE